ncbi:SGNH/GDSL hydrolase family protein [Geodermatophilus sp. SYSU D00700]
MARGTHWWSEPPAWAWVTMVAGLVTIVVLLPIALDRAAPASSATGAPATAGESGSSPTPTASAAPSAEPADSARVVVIGDSDTGGAAGEVAWPALLDERLPDAEIESVTTGDSGYVSTTAQESTLTDLVAEADLSDVDLVVLFGSRFDASGISDQVSAAAEESIATVRDEAPDAALVVIGPVWPGGDPPAGVRNNRDVVRAAAEAASVPFVDPLTEGWLAEDAGSVGEDDVHLTDEGQAALAGLVQPVVEGALDEAAGAGATSGG